MSLTKEKISELYSALNEKMKEQGVSGTLLVTGGAVMATVYDSRTSTQDIDAIFEPKQVFRNIIEEIATEQNLPSDWLNDGVKGFLDTTKMNQETFLELSNLKVNVLDAESMLALKLTSARLDSQDMEDSLVLLNEIKPKSIDEVYNIVESKCSKQQLTPISNFFIQEAFNIYEQNQKPTLKRQRPQVLPPNESIAEAKQEIEAHNKLHQSSPSISHKRHHI